VSFLPALLERLRATPRQYALYVAIYAAWGFLNNRLGQVWELARFAHWWQVITCYVLYLVPWSLFVRKLRVDQQYLYGLLALGLLELGGYSLGSSIAYPGNVFDRLFTERNFSLVMTLMFAGLLPAGNFLVSLAESVLFPEPASLTEPLSER